MLAHRLRELVDEHVLERVDVVAVAHAEALEHGNVLVRGARGLGLGHANADQDRFLELLLLHALFGAVARFGEKGNLEDASPAAQLCACEMVR